MSTAYAFDDPDHDNNIVATGAVLALITCTAMHGLESVSAVLDAEGNPTNQLNISLSFLRSDYRLTVERVT